MGLRGWAQPSLGHIQVVRHEGEGEEADGVPAGTPSAAVSMCERPANMDSDDGAPPG